MSQGPLYQTDDDLAWSVRRGNRQAFGEFFERIKDRLLRFCQARLPLGEGEDVISEACADLLLYLDEHEGIPQNGEHFRRLFYKTVHFKMLTYWQKSGRTISMEDLVEVGREPSVPAKVTEFPAVPPEQLEKALEKLVPAYQEVIRLRYFEGFENEEIAEIIGKTTATTTVIIHRALSRLRELIKENV